MLDYPFWVSEATHATFECAALTNLQISHKDACFECRPEKIKALQHVLAAAQSSLPFESYDPANLMMLEVSMANGNIT